MSGIEWAQRVAEARIQRQLEIADGLDAKGGILFAYCGAVIAGAGTLLRSGAEVAMALAIATATIGLLATVIILWPQTYRDPPDAEKLEGEILERRSKSIDIVEALLTQQLDGVAWNNGVLIGKGWALRVAIIAAVAATGLLGVEIAQGRGV